MARLCFSCRPPSIYQGGAPLAAMDLLQETTNQTANLRQNRGFCSPPPNHHQLQWATISRQDDKTCRLVDLAPALPTAPSAVAGPSSHRFTSPRPRPSWHHHIANLSPTIRWAIQHSRVLQNGQPIVAAIAAHQGFAVSDGSWKMDSGTACLLYTSPSPRDLSTSRMPSSA